MDCDLGKVLTTGITLASSFCRSVRGGGLDTNPGLVGKAEVECDVDTPPGNAEDELVLLKLGIGFAGFADPDGPGGFDADAVPDPEAEVLVGFEVGFFFCDAINSPRWCTTFSISSFFDKSRISSSKDL